MIMVIVASVISFVATEIDDFVMLLVLFSKTDKVSERLGVVVGKYLALAFLIASCTALSFYLEKIPDEILGLAGLVPLVVGIVYPYRKNKEKKFSVLWATASSLLLALETFLITLGNGADNICIYIPFFASLEGAEFFVMAVVFAVLQGAVCFAAIKIINSEAVQMYLGNFSKTIVPIAFILLGIYIMLKNGTVLWLLSFLRHSGV